MKKNLLFVAIVAFALSFVACNGKKAESTQSEEPAQEEVVTPAEEDSDVLAKYEAIVNKLIEIQGKVSTGDAEAVQECAKLTEEMASIATELQNEAAKMTPEQVQKFTELAQKWADATSKAPQQ